MDLNAYSPLVRRDLRNLEQDFNTKYREIEQKRDSDLYEIQQRTPPTFELQKPSQRKKADGHVWVGGLLIIALLVLVALHLVRLLLGMLFTITWDTWGLVVKTFLYGGGFYLVVYCYSWIKNSAAEDDYNKEIQAYNEAEEQHKKRLSEFENTQSREIREINFWFETKINKLREEYQEQQNAIIANAPERSKGNNKNMLF
jgi:hypothetical protein